MAVVPVPLTLCANHWGKLRAEIEARGLLPFCSTSPEETYRRLRAMGKLSRDNFEPLIDASMAIVANVLEAVPLSYFLDRPGCPLCTLQALHNSACDQADCDCGGTGFDQWIAAAAEDMVDDARELGLIGAA